MGLKTYPVVALTAVFSLMGYMISAMILKLKKDHEQAPVNQGYSKSKKIEIKFNMTYFPSLSTGLIGALYLAANKIGYPGMNQFPQALGYFGYVFICPILLVTSQAIIHWGRNIHIIRATKRLIWPDRVIPILE